MTSVQQQRRSRAAHGAVPSRSRHGAAPVIETPRLRLELAHPKQAAAHAAFMRRNQAHFAPWEPPRLFDTFDEAAWARSLAQSLQAWREDREVRWVLQPAAAAGGDIIGRANFTRIARGPFQSCVLGYQIDAGHEGQGLMREALAAAVDWMFKRKRLHRIEANYRPENERSGRLLDRLGFERSGLARGYLFIDGAWRDHVQVQRLNPDFDPDWLLPAD